MGQQQLILLVLAVIIVGLAIVVGIRAFTENAIRSNSDAMLQDAVRIANDLQAWKQKPAPFGGQASCIPAGDATQAQVNNTADFTCANFPRIGYSPVSGEGPLMYQNLNGTFELRNVGTATEIVGYNTQQNNEILVTLIGITDTDINGEVTCLGGSDAAGEACTAGDAGGGGG